MLNDGVGGQFDIALDVRADIRPELAYFLVLKTEDFVIKTAKPDKAQYFGTLHTPSLSLYWISMLQP